MIRINLLGKKHSAAGGMPFGLDEKLAQLGINPADLQELKPNLIRLAVLLAGLYLADAIPTHIHETKKMELDAEISQYSQQADKLRQDLASKRDIRKQMEQLNNEEAELQRQLNAVSALQKNRGLAFRTLDNLVVSLPEKVWFTKIQYNEKKIEVSGACWEYFPINDFVKAINDSTQYSSVVFGGIATQAPSSYIDGVPEAIQKKKTFTVTFDVVGMGAT